MCNIDQSLKPLTDIVFESDSSTRGHGLAAENSDHSDPHDRVTILFPSCTVQARPTRVWLFSGPTPKTPRRITRPDNTKQPGQLGVIALESHR